MPRSHAAYPIRRLVVAAVGALALGGCGATIERVAAIGVEPELAPIENPVSRPDYRPVSLPMPAPEPVVHQANSLWRSGARAFLKDQRAQGVGDILTVLIAINDDATVNNKTKRTRDANEDATVSRLFGYEASLNRLLPEAVVAGNLVDIDSDTLSDSVGEIKRDESINLGAAAVVTQVLPNGNLVIHGSQEVRVNFGIRELSVDGVIRPEDVSTSNTVSHDQIAEARIAYGGRGTISDIQRPRYGQELFDIFYPF